MESRTHYIVVGLFVLVLSGAAVFFALWMGNLDEKRHSYRYYYTYMFESVSGLPKDGAVKYMGVEIGKVVAIDVDSKTPNRVRLTLKLPADFVVTNSMYTQLKLEGITGIAYVEISGGKYGAKPIVTEKGKIPVIPSRPSALSQLGDALPEVTLNVSHAFKRIGDALDDETIGHFHHTMAKLDEVTHRLDDLLNEKNIRNVQTLLENITAASRNLQTLQKTAAALQRAADTVAIEGNTTLRAVTRSAHAIERAGDAFTQRVLSGQFDVKNMFADTIVQIDQLLQQTQTLVIELRQAVERLENSPADLLYKRAAPTLGPGESK